ncbi:MAG: DUF3572 domain-containing protein [Pseudomonadota bacterium]
MTEAEAERVAIAALTHLAAEPERIGAFLTAAGAAPGDLRDRATDPAFLGFVLDFLLGDEDSVIAFAEETGMAPEIVMQARRALPGGDVPEWT